MFPGSNIPVEPNSSSPHRWDGLFPCGSEDAPLPVGGAAGGGGAGEVGLALEVVDVTEGSAKPAISIASYYRVKHWTAPL